MVENVVPKTLITFTWKSYLRNRRTKSPEYYQIDWHQKLPTYLQHMYTERVNLEFYKIVQLNIFLS